MKILFATKNPAKIKGFKEPLKEKGIEILTIHDIDKKVMVEENGQTAIENAAIKAKTYYETTGITSIGIDDNLIIEGLPDEKQPRTHVRRVNGKELTDEEMLVHYSNLVHSLGGKANAYWIHGIAICNGGKVHTLEKRTNIKLLEKRSHIVTKGYPLDSISYEEQTGKFYSELTKEDKAKINTRKQEKAREIANFLVEHI